MDSPLFTDRINNDIASHKLVYMPCNCSIEYWGRSRSVIGTGDRAIIIKPDSTLLVHSVSGFKPINWMSMPADTISSPGEDYFLIHSQRTRKPYEEMKIKVFEVHDYRALEGLRDGEKLKLTHTEKDMQDYLAENPRKVHPAFRLKATEYRTFLGFLDLYGKIDDQYCVVELKCDRAGLPAALQIKRYRDWLNQHLKQDVKSILMAPSITQNAQKLLKKNGIEFKKFNIKRVKRKTLSRNTLSKWINDESKQIK